MIKSEKGSALTVVLIIIIVLIILAGGGFFVYQYLNQDATKSDSDSSSDELKFQEVNAAEAKDLIDDKGNLTILDVSTSYVDGHLPGAVNIILTELSDSMELLEKDKPVLVYCHFRIASVEAANMLVEGGFKEVYRLNGDYKAWVDAGYEVEAGEGVKLQVDTDEDGLSDKEEEELGSDPYKADTDDDGLDDYKESKLGTDFNNKDTDGDGYMDGDEVDDGYDPLAKPDEDQNKIMVDERIDLEDASGVGAEGVAFRYFKDNKFYLDITATLPRQEEKDYKAWGVKSDGSETQEFGNMEFLSNADEESEELIATSNYELKFESDTNYFDYIDLMIGTKDGDEYDEVLSGEFTGVEN